MHEVAVGEPARPEGPRVERWSTAELLDTEHMGGHDLTDRGRELESMAGESNSQVQAGDVSDLGGPSEDGVIVRRDVIGPAGRRHSLGDRHRGEPLGHSPADAHGVIGVVVGRGVGLKVAVGTKVEAGLMVTVG